MNHTAAPLPNLCHWTGSRPGPGESINCTACGRTCTGRDVRLCRARGPEPVPIKSPPARSPKPVKRLDWLAELGGCGHAGEVIESLACGCVGQDEVAIRSCSQPTLSGECVVLNSDLKRLSRKHRDRAKSVTACESCTLRTSVESPTLGPFTSQPIRHCLGHLYPFAGNDLWRWHVAQLVDRLPLFNGRRLVSVALDANTVSRPEVEAAWAGHAVELRFLANRKATGETDSFRWGLEQLQGEIDNPNACLFYWHSKGVSTREHDPKHNWHSVRRWADSMWRTCGDCWPLVQQQLETAHATGSHRQPWPGTPRIHFAGTFFWVRLAALIGRPWHQLDTDRFAVERWPGQMFLPRETACLFDDRPHDRTAPGTLYRESTWAALNDSLHIFLDTHSTRKETMPITPPPPKALRVGLDLDGVLYSHPNLFGPLIEAMHAAGHRFFCTSSHGRDQWPVDCERLRLNGINPDLISPEMMYSQQHGDVKKKAAQADQLDFVFDDDLRIQQYTKTPILSPAVDGLYSFRDHS